MSISVKIFRIDKDLPLPKYESGGAVGFDFVCRKTVNIKPKEIVLIPANVIIEVPSGFSLFVTLRSSTPKKKGLIIPHGVGVIDQDYCGKDDEIKIQVQNISENEVQIKRGERVAQGIFLRTEQFNFLEIEKIENKTRGGFGSTG